jgi:hypothetical protein
MTSRIFARDSVIADATQTNAPVVSEVGQSIAGRARYVWETIHGESAVLGEPALVPFNPQGLIGIDHSGPPYGACLLLPVATWVGQSLLAQSPTSVLTAIGSTAKAVDDWRVWNRPHAVRVDGTAPLQQLAFSWRGVATAGTSSVFRVTVVNKRNGSTTVIDRTIDGTTTSSYHEAELVPFIVGENVLSVSIRRVSGTRTLTVLSMAFDVVAKRRHGISFPG